MARFSTAPVLEIEQLAPAARRAADEATTKMHKRTALRQLPKLTELADRGRRIVERPPLITSVGFGHDFDVRQLRDRKYSFDLTGLSPVGMETYVRVCATTPARAHARTGDPAAISGYLGSGDSFPDAVAEWALRFADRARADHAALVAAIRDGRVEALHDV